MTEPTTPAHVDANPPPTGIWAVWRHLTNWATLYFWLPLSLISIWLFSKLAYLLTGRKPQENADWIVGFSFTLVKCVFLVFFVEITRQQTGTWYTKAELIANPQLAWSQTVSKCVTLIVFAWLLSQ